MILPFAQQKRSLTWLREALERALTMTTDTLLYQYLATQINNIDLMLESWPRGDAETAQDVLLDQVECEVSRELYGDDADGNRGVYMTTVELLTDSATIEGLAGDEVVGQFSGRWSGDHGATLDVMFTLVSYDGDIATYRVASADCAVFA